MSDPNKNRKGYKATKVGWIPKAWECARIDSIAEVGYGLTVNKERRNAPRKMSYLTVANFGVDGLKLENIKQIGCLDGDDRYTLNLHDILVVEGNGSRDLVGMGSLWTGLPYPVLHQNHLIRVRVNQQLAKPSLISEILRSQGFRRRLQPRIVTSSGLHTINSQVVSSSLVPLPPLSEQQEIVAILSTWEDGLEQLEALIKAKTRQKQALMQQLLTGETRLPGFEGEWIQTPLDEILRHVFRPVAWHQETLFDLVSIRRRAGGLFRRGLTQGADYKTKDLHRIQAGDLLISKRQVTHGALTVVPQEFEGGIVSKEYSIFENIAPKRLEMSFLNWLTKEKKFWWICFVASNGVDIEKLIFVPKDFLKSSISLPPTIKEQTAIATLLTTAETELTHLRKKQLALRQQKKSLMQKLLTGEVRVSS